MTRVCGPIAPAISAAVADRRDPLAADRDGLGPRPAGVDGVDVAAGEDEVGGSIWHARHDGTRRRPRSPATAHRAERAAA